MRFKILAAIFLFTLLIPVESTCHYSCLNCTQASYTSCTSCYNNSSFTYILSQNPTVGTCSQLLTSQANVSGIILLIMAVCIMPVFFFEEIVHLFLFFQTLGLFYLVEIYYIPILDYMLSGCSYLMLISRMTHSYKTATLGLNADVLKGRMFFGSYSFNSNIVVIGVLNVVVFLILFFLPLFKNIRKQCVTERVHFCSDWLLDKIVLATATIFIFLIQQSVAVIYFSLKYDQFSAVEVIITILYFIILIAFTINQFLYPLIFFRSKLAQINMIIAKAITPIFLAGSTNSHFIVFPLVIIFHIFDAIVTNKNRNANTFNRLFAYKIISILVLFLFTVLYLVEIQANNPSFSRIFEYICCVGIFGILCFLILELIIKVKQVVDSKGRAESQELENKDVTIATIEEAKEDVQKAQIFSDSLYMQEPKSENSPQKHSKSESVFPEISEQAPQNRKSVNKVECVKVSPNNAQKTEEQLEGSRKIESGDLLQENEENYCTQQQQADSYKRSTSESIEAKERDEKDKPKRLAKRKKDKKISK